MSINSFLWCIVGVTSTPPCGSIATGVSAEPAGRIVVNEQQYQNDMNCAWLITADDPDQVSTTNGRYAKPLSFHIWILQMAPILIVWVIIYYRHKVIPTETGFLTSAGTFLFVFGDNIYHLPLFASIDAIVFPIVDFRKKKFPLKTKLDMYSYPIQNQTIIDFTISSRKCVVTIVTTERYMKHDTNADQSLFLSANRHWFPFYQRGTKLWW